MSDGGNASDKAPVLSFLVVWLMILSKAVIVQDYIQPQTPSHVQNIKADVMPGALSEGTVDQETAVLCAINSGLNVAHSTSAFLPLRLLAVAMETICFPTVRPWSA